MKYLCKNFFPLSITSRSQLLCFKGGSFYLKELGSDSSSIFIVRMPEYRHRFISKFRMFERILRNCPGPSIAINDSVFLYHYKSKIYRLDLEKKSIFLEMTLDNPKKILYFSRKICKLTGDIEIYFGEYFENQKKEKVNIWYRTSTGFWSVYSSFPPGSIEHIHNIVVDYSGDRLLILTGDFGDGSGIWSLAGLGQQPIELARGKQLYRAAWACIEGSKMIYATDTPLEENFLIEVDISSHSFEPQKKYPIGGSSIYGGSQRDGKIYFSTAIEPTESSGNRLLDLFQIKRGRGIMQNRAYLYRYDKFTGELEVLIWAAKDIIPMRLGQYGTFLLSPSFSNHDSILVYGIGLKKYDAKLIEF